MTNEMIQNTNDSELIMLYHENNEDAKNILFLKYKSIIGFVIKKYSKMINYLNIDYQEVYSECNVGFSDALRCFQEDKDVLLPTFITLCIERKIKGLLKKYSTEKNKIFKESYSLDYIYDDIGKPLLEILKCDSYDPLSDMTDKENCKELLKEINQILSPNEKEVFDLMISGFNYKQISKILNKTPKQIDNTEQRIRLKIKNIISTENKI